MSIELSSLFVSELVALVAIASLYISNIVYVDSTSPEVIVYLEQNNDSPEIIDLVIENIGKGVAKDVTFNTSKPLPYHAWDENKLKFMEDGPIIKGIPFFAPKAKRKFQFGNYVGISNYIGNEIISLEVTCKSKHRTLLGFKKVRSTSYLDIYSFAGIDASDNSNLKKVAKHLGDISKVAKTISERTRG